MSPGKRVPQTLELLNTTPVRGSNSLTLSASANLLVGQTGVSSLTWEFNGMGIQWNPTRRIGLCSQHRQHLGQGGLSGACGA